MSITRDRTSASAGPPARAAGLPAAARPDPIRLARHLPTIRRRRLLRDLCRNAEWVDQARTTPTLQDWMDSQSNSRRTPAGRG